MIICELRPPSPRGFIFTTRMTEVSIIHLDFETWIHPNGGCLDKPVGWEEFPHAERLKGEIGAIIEKSQNRAILGRLRNVILAVEEFHRLSEKQHFSDHEIRQLAHWQRWRWRFVYNLKRLAVRHPAIEGDLENLINLILETRTAQGRPVIEWLEIPVRWAEFSTRRNS